MLLCVALTILERNIIRVYIYYKKNKQKYQCFVIIVINAVLYPCAAINICRQIFRSFFLELLHYMQFLTYKHESA